MAKCSVLCQIGNVQTLTLTFTKSRVQWAQNRISEWEYSDHTPQKVGPRVRPWAGGGTLFRPTPGHGRGPGAQPWGNLQTLTLTTTRGPCPRPEPGVAPAPGHGPGRGPNTGGQCPNPNPNVQTLTLTATRGPCPRPELGLAPTPGHGPGRGPNTGGQRLGRGKVLHSLPNRQCPNPNPNFR